MIDQYWNERDGVKDALGDRIQTAINITHQIIATWQMRAVTRHQSIQGLAQEEGFDERNRLHAQLRADTPIMRQAFSRSWWRNVQDPEDIAQVVEVAGSWARAKEPIGVRTFEELRRQLKSRYGVEIDLSTVDSSIVLDQLAEAFASPEELDALALAKGAAEARGEDPETVVKAALIRQEIGNEDWWSAAPDGEIAAVVHQVQGWPSGRAKTELLQWVQEQGMRYLSPGEFDFNALLGEEAQKKPKQAPAVQVEPSSETDTETILLRDEANKEALAALGDPELQEHVAAAASFNEGVPPTRRLNQSSRRGLGPRRRNRGQQLASDKEVSR